jgi:hypothetical protein
MSQFLPFSVLIHFSDLNIASSFFGILELIAYFCGSSANLLLGRLNGILTGICLILDFVIPFYFSLRFRAVIIYNIPNFERTSILIDHVRISYKHNRQYCGNPLIRRFLCHIRRK